MSAGKAVRGLRERLAEPVDIASLVMARILFGLLMLWMVVRYFGKGRIGRYWIEPEFHFGYFGFDWVAPWAGDGMYWHFLGLGLLAFADHLRVVLPRCRRPVFRRFQLRLPARTGALSESRLPGVPGELIDGGGAGASGRVAGREVRFLPALGYRPGVVSVAPALPDRRRCPACRTRFASSPYAADIRAGFTWPIKAMT